MKIARVGICSHSKQLKSGFVIMPWNPLLLHVLFQILCLFVGCMGWFLIWLSIRMVNCETVGWGKYPIRDNRYQMLL